MGAHCRAGDVAAKKLLLLPLPIYFCDLQTPQPPPACLSQALQFACRKNALENYRVMFLYIRKISSVNPKSQLF
jgi:hypothetical protein